MTVTRDVVIFGSGFAAFEIGRECAARGMSVEVFERGPAMPEAGAASLAAVPHRREPIRSGGVAFGANVPEGFETAPRYIGVGGTSELWSGKWRPLDRLDLEREAGGRRWPFSIRELEPWYAQVNSEIGWTDLSTDPVRQEVESIVEQAGLRLVDIREQSLPLRLRPAWEVLRESGRVNMNCLAHLVTPVYDTTGRVIEAVRVRDHDSARLVAAERFVVACGGIESIHVSHSLRWPKSGRRLTEPEPSAYSGFMDHPKARIGQARVTTGRRFLECLHNASKHGHLVSLSLPEKELRAQSIGNHTLAVWPMASSGDPLLQLTLSLEQFPEEDNRVLRQPAPEVVWRMSRETWNDGDRFLALLIPRLESVLGPVTLLPAFRFSGASHHAGALPMGAHPSSALREDLRFHDVDNLYCASSAAFPIAGSANPTMTIVALSRRLAHHIASAA